MNNPLLRNVSMEERLRFWRDGVVCLRRIISPEWIKLAQDGIEQQRQAPSPHATVVDADPLYLLIDQMPSVENGMLKRVVFESGAGEIARQLTVTTRLRWVYDQLFYKGRGPVPETPGTRTPRTDSQTAIASSACGCRSTTSRARRPSRWCAARISGMLAI